MAHHHGNRIAAARFFVGVVAVFSVTVLLALSAVALVPSTALRWQPAVITSGSMSPRISVGDIVVAKPYRGGTLDQGTVTVFHDAGGHGLVTHRIVERNLDGTYVTQGDANPAADSTPLRSEQIVGTGRLLIPLAGYPVAWLRNGETAKAMAFVVGLTLALWLARYGLLNRYDPWRGRHGPVAEEAALAVAPQPRALAAWLAVFALGLPLTGERMATSAAAWNATTSNSGSSLAAAAAFCQGAGSAVLTAVRDTYVNEAQPTTQNGAATTLHVRSQDVAARRTLVAFDLSSVPAGCTVTGATLELFASAGQTGRTIAVRRAATTWAENVTWNTQPAMTGTAVTAASGTGLRTWTVTAHVQALQVGPNTGFVVADSVETGGRSREQSYHSRESTTDPTLRVTWG